MKGKHAVVWAALVMMLASGCASAPPLIFQSDATRAKWGQEKAEAIAGHLDRKAQATQALQACEASHAATSAFPFSGVSIMQMQAQLASTNPCQERVWELAAAQERYERSCEEYRRNMSGAEAAVCTRVRYLAISGY